MTEEKAKYFMAKNGIHLLIRLGIIDEKGEPKSPLAHYFDDISNKIYTTTPRLLRKLAIKKEYHHLLY